MNPNLYNIIIANRISNVKKFMLPDNFDKFIILIT